MSDKCSHNDHGHILIWMVIFALCFNSPLVDCTGERAKEKAQVDAQRVEITGLRARIEQLEAAETKTTSP